MMRIIRKTAMPISLFDDVDDDDDDGDEDEEEYDDCDHSIGDAAAAAEKLLLLLFSDDGADDDGHETAMTMVTTMIWSQVLHLMRLAHRIPQTRSRLPSQSPIGSPPEWWRPKHTAFGAYGVRTG